MTRAASRAWAWPTPLPTGGPATCADIPWPRKCSSFAWTLADIQPQIQAACEGDWSMDKCNLVGERIWNLEKQFNLAAGLTKKDDDLPPRLKTEPAKTGPAKGLVNGIDKMLPEYYQIRGWSPEGVPNTDTLQRLGL
ncbi:MAG: aldehyde ferredoxin oxidoreductase [Proteobacteria bacterium]|nr:aldehyde ferredoxin oxidoreductase [Pseudomonadota bacterium]